jgi:hypothetical protein
MAKVFMGTSKPLPIGHTAEGGPMYPESPELGPIGKPGVAERTGELHNIGEGEAPPAVKKAIAGTGLEFRGRDEMGINHLHDPQTGTTLAVLDKDLDNAKLKERLAEKRKQFNVEK